MKNDGQKRGHDEDSVKHRKVVDTHFEAVHARWQYSLFGLLVVTTILSICLAFGVNYPRIALTMLAVVLVQVWAMYWIEWLMRRPGGKTMPRVTASLWAILFVTMAGLLVGMAIMAAFYWTLIANQVN